MVFFPIVLLYYEVMFSVFTTGNFIKQGAIYNLFFCISYGLIIHILISCIKGKNGNIVLSMSVTLLIAIIYLAESFIYDGFKVFYDISTVISGAGDMFGGFAREVSTFILTPAGIAKILIFLLPVSVYYIISTVFLTPQRITKPRFIFSGVLAVIIFVINVVAISFSSVYGELYKDSYSFQTAVDNFGLSTAIRLDIKKHIMGYEAEAFEETKEVAMPEVTEYPYNMMELDFSKECNRNIQGLNEYVESILPSKQNEYTGIFKGKNLILISAEAFSSKVIDEKLTPTLYRLATKGINFTDYYQPASAGTTGGEYQNIFGMLPTSGGASFKKTAYNNNYFTIGSQLNRLGYYGMAYHNNSYTYYDRHKTHCNLGYSGGYMGYGNGMEQYVENVWPQSDLEMFEGTLPTYIDRGPFSVYYMTVSGHSGYYRNVNKMSEKNWDKVKELDYSEPVKGYIAANLELENALSYLVSTLENKGIAENTVICISTDHFPYGLDENGTLGNMPYLSELYGYNVCDIFERDRSRLILWSKSLEENAPIIVDTPTSSLDILPTLSNLFGTEFDSRLMVGRDVFSDAKPLVFLMNYNWKTDKGTYYASTGKFIPSNESEMVSEEYIENIKKIVKNKINYCRGVLDFDYFGYLFNETE